MVIANFLRWPSGRGSEVQGFRVQGLATGCRWLIIVLRHLTSFYRYITSEPLNVEPSD